jgi:hypothetical protein
MLKVINLIKVKLSGVFGERNHTAVLASARASPSTCAPEIPALFT